MMHFKDKDFYFPIWGLVVFLLLFCFMIETQMSERTLLLDLGLSLSSNYEFSGVTCYECCLKIPLQLKKDILSEVKEQMRMPGLEAWKK